MNGQDLNKYIRSVKDFPKPGIDFKDITPLLQDNIAFSLCIKLLKEKIQETIKVKIDKIASPESRGFIFGSTLANSLNLGFIPIRKEGKLPYKTIHVDYGLEYGQDSLYIHEDATTKNENILIVDDILATGGTAVACASLVEKLSANVVGFAFLGEIVDLNATKNYPILSNNEVLSIIKW